MDKVLRIDMTHKTVAWEALKKDYDLFGNRGLIARVLNDEVDPACDPLGPENKLVFAMGLLAGTGFPTANRFSVGTKSPLTGGIKEANSGGNIGFVLASHGIQLIIIEGKPKDGDLSLLVIKADGQAELIDARAYAGMGTYELVEKMKADRGDKIAAACIGGAGERGYANSTIQVTDFATGHPSRSLARGGVGSVMGAKGLKAIVIEPARTRARVEYADREKFSGALRAYLQVLDRSIAMKAMNRFGTMIGMAVTGKNGALPVKNFSGQRCEILEDIGVTKFYQTINRRGANYQMACQPGCPIKCHNTWVDEKGDYVTSGLEYETIALIGSNCNIRDLDLIAKIERMCDDFGIDTIELGATIGVCMEAGKLPWGDADGAMALVKEIIEGTEFGKRMAGGTRATGEYLGVKRIPCVKGQAMAGYDPRNSKGTGVGYATSPQGADHTVGTTSGSAGDFNKVGRIQMSQKVQVLYALADNFFCHFAAMPLASTHKFAILHIADAMAGRFGGEWTADKVFGIGLQTLILEKKFNRGAGFTAKDDHLPQFFYEEPSAVTGAVFDFTDEELAQVLPF